jgi:hypothetical protein
MMRNTRHLYWEHEKGDVIFSSNGYLVFDDTVLEPVQDFLKMSILWFIDNQLY